ALLLQATADFVFDLPWGARLILLLLDLAGLGWLTWRFLIRPWLRRLDRKGAALLIEREIPEFRSSLISSYEFTLPGADVLPQSAPPVGQPVEDTAARLSHTRELSHIVRPDRLKRFALWMLVPLLLAGGFGTLLPDISGLLIRRVFLSNARFPAE